MSTTGTASDSIMALIQNKQKHGPTGLALCDGADAGNLNIIVMIAETKDAPPTYRAPGMGAPRYLRNTL